MKLSIGTAHALFLGLAAIEGGADVKVSADVRLAIAINMNKLRPTAEAYERARTRSLATLYAVNRGADGRPLRCDAELQADALDADAAMRSAESDELELRTILKADLRLADNAKITGVVLAQVAPIISDFA